MSSTTDTTWSNTTTAQMLNEQRYEALITEAVKLLREAQKIHKESTTGIDAAIHDLGADLWDC